VGERGEAKGDSTPSSEKRVFKGRSDLHGVGSIMDGDN
jgi:hypothetical protein